MMLLETTEDSDVVAALANLSEALDFEIVARCAEPTCEVCSGLQFPVAA